MQQFVEGAARFRAEIYPPQKALYRHLAAHGQAPKAMVISCSDSRVIPEVLTGSDPGQMFVCRNAGNVVPPFGQDSGGGVAAAIEYAVVGLGVEHLIVCGHTDCGAMKALLDPGSVAEMPTVASWLGHCRCAQGVFRKIHAGKVADGDAARVMAMENVIAQLAHLRTHPSVATKLAAAEIELHGWLFDIESGRILALDETSGEFQPIEEHASRGRERVPRRQRMIAAA